LQKYQSSATQVNSGLSGLKPQTSFRLLEFAAGCSAARFLGVLGEVVLIVVERRQRRRGVRRLDQGVGLRVGIAPKLEPAPEAKISSPVG